MNTPTPLVNRYLRLSPDLLEEHLSGYLISHWSYSGVTTFARNEKEFERAYIYHEDSRSGASSIAGNAYHEALAAYFRTSMSDAEELPLRQLEEEAYAYIDSVEANKIKISKTSPTVEQTQQAAIKAVTTLLRNFYTERDIYISRIHRILAVEEKQLAWVLVSGVDVPLPLKFQTDLVVELVDGRRIIIDHKSRQSFTDEKEMQFTAGKQAITYVLGWEALHPDLPIDAVWFIENKIPQNKDKSPQLKKFEIPMDPDNRRLHEALLFEPLRRMLDAVSNPDYLYTINDSDKLADIAELYDFWARTVLSDIDSFNIPEEKRDLLARRQKKIHDASAVAISPRVITSFRKKASTFISYELRKDMTPEQRIEHTLLAFNLKVRVAHVVGEYSSRSYLLEIGAGVMISNIRKHHLDIANALNVPSVRILPDLVQYGPEGKVYLCIETQQRNNNVLLFNPDDLHGLHLPLGHDNYGHILTWDLNNQSTPHMLVCGATGSGKSVFLRSTIEYALQAGIARIIIMDPKFEFISEYSNRCEVISDIEDIEVRMNDLVDEMQQRAREGKREFTLVIFDEFADAVTSARSQKECAAAGLRPLEVCLKMLTQKGRSLGYRVIAATQRASTRIITGDTKVNFPVQVCFRVPKKVDSQVVIDEEGAETLAGHGDGLLRSPQYNGTMRFQGYYKMS